MKLKVDPILVIILGTLALGLLLPVSGRPAEILDLVTRVGVFVLFFGYGARLSAAETRSGLKNWRLHLAILSTTFVVFPLLAVPVLAIPDAVLSAPIRVGLIFLCLVPSTVQSSITFTSLAGGNVAAATLIGKRIAEKAKAAGVEKVAFDRAGFAYHGRVKALADAAREAGLQF